MERHGDGAKYNRPTEYRIWNAMKGRCFNPKNKAYKYYGARGITVCDRWKNSYISFLADMGRRPDGFHLDRENNDGNYEPSNCKWVTKTQNARNKRNNVMISHDGKTMCLSEWAENLSISVFTLHSRLFLRKWPVHKTLTTPCIKNRRNRNATF